MDRVRLLAARYRGRVGCALAAFALALLLAASADAAEVRVDFGERPGECG